MFMIFQTVDIFYKICYIFDQSSALACRVESIKFLFQLSKLDKLRPFSQHFNHTASVSQRQVQKVTTTFKRILGFGDCTWILHEKCIQISTNILQIHLVICEMCDLRILPGGGGGSQV